MRSWMAGIHREGRFKDKAVKLKLVADEEIKIRVGKGPKHVR